MAHRLVGSLCCVWAPCPTPWSHHWTSWGLLRTPHCSLPTSLDRGGRQQPFWNPGPKANLASSVPVPVLPSLGLTVLEVACNMELPHGGEGWQQLRQGYLPPEFTAGKWRSGMVLPPTRGVLGDGMAGGGDHWPPGPVAPDTALPCGQAYLPSCVLSSP